MHSKLVLYVLALLTGLAVGPQASAGAEKAQAVEQCAATSTMDAGASAWFADLAQGGAAKAQATTAPKTKANAPSGDQSGCTGDTPVSRKDSQRE